MPRTPKPKPKPKPSQGRPIPKLSATSGIYSAPHPTVTTLAPGDVMPWTSLTNLIEEAPHE